MQKVIADMQDAAQKLGIRIELSSGCRKLPFEGDRTRLTRSFYNILENSLKYMNTAGKIMVTVSVVDNQVLIVFKDSGAGMDREEAEHIFELNYRGSNSVQGNGMGLYPRLRHRDCAPWECDRAQQPGKRDDHSDAASAFPAGGLLRACRGQSGGVIHKKSIAQRGGRAGLRQKFFRKVLEMA